MSSYNGQERRKHKRIDASFIVSYRIKQEINNSDLSQTKNVSEGGMLLTTNRKFDKGTYLEMTIRFPFLPNKIEILGEVVSSTEKVKNLIYETRLKFFGLEEALVGELAKFIQHNLR